MSGEFDFLDDLLSEITLKPSESQCIVEESNKYVEPRKKSSIKSELEQKLRKDNARLRCRLKTYSKSLNEQGVRLTQLLTEKLSMREEQEKIQDCKKKLEEANVYIQATEQLNKQLHELAKTYENDKSILNQKIQTLQSKVRKLNKEINRTNHQKLQEKKRRVKQLRILIELSEILITLGLLPLKYKRLHENWKYEASQNEDEEVEEDHDDDKEKTQEEEEHTVLSLPSSRAKVQVSAKELLKAMANGRKEEATLEVMSGSESSDEERCRTRLPSTKNPPNVVPSIDSVKDLCKRLIKSTGDMLMVGSDLGSTVTSPYSSLSGGDQLESERTSGSSEGSSSSRMVSPQLSSGVKRLSREVDKTENGVTMSSEDEDWHWDGDASSGGLKLNGINEEKRLIDGGGKQEGLKKNQVAVEKSNGYNKWLEVEAILKEMCFKSVPLLQPFEEKAFPSHSHESVCSNKKLGKKLAEQLVEAAGEPKSVSETASQRVSTVPALPCAEVQSSSHIPKNMLLADQFVQKGPENINGTSTICDQEVAIFTVDAAEGKSLRNVSPPRHNNECEVTNDIRVSKNLVTNDCKGVIDGAFHGKLCNYIKQSQKEDIIKSNEVSSDLSTVIVNKTVSDLGNVSDSIQSAFAEMNAEEGCDYLNEKPEKYREQPKKTKDKSNGNNAGKGRGRPRKIRQEEKEESKENEQAGGEKQENVAKPESSADKIVNPLKEGWQRRFSPRLQKNMHKGEVTCPTIVNNCVEVPSEVESECSLDNNSAKGIKLSEAKKGKRKPRSTRPIVDYSDTSDTCDSVMPPKLNLVRSVPSEPLEAIEKCTKEVNIGVQGPSKNNLMLEEEEKDSGVQTRSKKLKKSYSKYRPKGDIPCIMEESVTPHSEELSSPMQVCSDLESHVCGEEGSIIGKDSGQFATDDSTSSEGDMGSVSFIENSPISLGSLECSSAEDCGTSVSASSINSTSNGSGSMADSEEMSGNSCYSEEEQGSEKSEIESSDRPVNVDHCEGFSRDQAVLSLSHPSLLLSSNEGNVEYCDALPVLDKCDSDMGQFPNTRKEGDCESRKDSAQNVSTAPIVNDYTPSSMNPSKSAKSPTSVTNYSGSFTSNQKESHASIQVFPDSHKSVGNKQPKESTSYEVHDRELPLEVHHTHSQVKKVLNNHEDEGIINLVSSKEIRKFEPEGWPSIEKSFEVPNENPSSNTLHTQNDDSLLEAPDPHSAPQVEKAKSMEISVPSHGCCKSNIAPVETSNNKESFQKDYEDLEEFSERSFNKGSDNASMPQLPVKEKNQQKPEKCLLASLREKSRSILDMACEKTMAIMSGGYSRRHPIPFYFGDRHLFRFPGVKFRIGGHFASEFYPEPYSVPNYPILTFGKGDFQKLYQSLRAMNTSTKSMAWVYSGVKFYKRGSFAPPNYSDLYLNPKRLSVNMKTTIFKKIAVNRTENNSPCASDYISLTSCSEEAYSKDNLYANCAPVYSSMEKAEISSKESFIAQCNDQGNSSGTISVASVEVDVTVSSDVVVDDFMTSNHVSQSSIAGESETVSQKSQIFNEKQSNSPTVRRGSSSEQQYNFCTESDSFFERQKLLLEERPGKSSLLSSHQGNKILPGHDLALRGFSWETTSCAVMAAIAGGSKCHGESASSSRLKEATEEVSQKEGTQHHGNRAAIYNQSAENIRAPGSAETSSHDSCDSFFNGTSTQYSSEGYLSDKEDSPGGSVIDFGNNKNYCNSHVEGNSLKEFCGTILTSSDSGNVDLRRASNNSLADDLCNSEEVTPRDVGHPDESCRDTQLLRDQNLGCFNKSRGHLKDLTVSSTCSSTILTSNNSIEVDPSKPNNNSVVSCPSNSEEVAPKDVGQQGEIYRGVPLSSVGNFEDFHKSNVKMKDLEVSGTCSTIVLTSNNYAELAPKNRDNSNQTDCLSNLEVKPTGVGGGVSLQDESYRCPTLSIDQGFDESRVDLKERTASNIHSNSVVSVGCEEEVVEGRTGKKEKCDLISVLETTRPTITNEVNGRTLNERKNQEKIDDVGITGDVGIDDLIMAICPGGPIPDVSFKSGSTNENVIFGNDGSNLLHIDLPLDNAAFPAKLGEEKENFMDIFDPENEITQTNEKKTQGEEKDSSLVELQIGADIFPSTCSEESAYGTMSGPALSSSGSADSSPVIANQLPDLVLKEKAAEAMHIHKCLMAENLDALIELAGGLHSFEDGCMGSDAIELSEALSEENILSKSPVSTKRKSGNANNVTEAGVFTDKFKDSSHNSELVEWSISPLSEMKKTEIKSLSFTGSEGELKKNLPGGERNSSVYNSVPKSKIDFDKNLTSKELVSHSGCCLDSSPLPTDKSHSHSAGHSSVQSCVNSIIGHQNNKNVDGLLELAVEMEGSKDKGVGDPFCSDRELRVLEISVDKTNESSVIDLIGQSDGALVTRTVITEKHDKTLECMDGTCPVKVSCNQTSTEKAPSYVELADSEPIVEREEETGDFKVSPTSEVDVGKEGSAVLQSTKPTHEENEMVGSFVESQNRVQSNCNKSKELSDQVTNVEIEGTTRVNEFSAIDLMQEQDLHKTPDGGLGNNMTIKEKESSNGSASPTIGAVENKVVEKNLFGSDFSDTSSDSEPVIDPQPISKKQKKIKARIIYSSESESEGLKRIKENEEGPPPAKRPKVHRGRRKSFRSKCDVLFGSPVSVNDSVDSSLASNGSDCQSPMTNDDIHESLTCGRNKKIGGNTGEAGESDNGLQEFRSDCSSGPLNTNNKQKKIVIADTIISDRVKPVNDNVLTLPVNVRCNRETCMPKPSAPSPPGELRSTGMLSTRVYASRKSRTPKQQLSIQVELKNGEEKDITLPDELYDAKLIQIEDGLDASAMPSSPEEAETIYNAYERESVMFTERSPKEIKSETLIPAKVPPACRRKSRKQSFIGKIRCNDETLNGEDSMEGMLSFQMENQEELSSPNAANVPKRTTKATRVKRNKPGKINKTRSSSGRLNKRVCRKDKISEDEEHNQSSEKCTSNIPQLSSAVAECNTSSVPNSPSNLHSEENCSDDDTSTCEEQEHLQPLKRGIARVSKAFTDVHKINPLTNSSSKSVQSSKKNNEGKTHVLEEGRYIKPKKRVAYIPEVSPTLAEINTSLENNCLSNENLKEMDNEVETSIDEEEVYNIPYKKKHITKVSTVVAKPSKSSIKKDTSKANTKEKSNEETSNFTKQVISLPLKKRIARLPKNFISGAKLNTIPINNCPSSKVMNLEENDNEKESVVREEEGYKPPFKKRIAHVPRLTPQVGNVNTNLSGIGTSPGMSLKENENNTGEIQDQEFEPPSKKRIAHIPRVMTLTKTNHSFSQDKNSSEMDAKENSNEKVTLVQEESYYNPPTKKRIAHIPKGLSESSNMSNIDTSVSETDSPLVTRSSVLNKKKKAPKAKMSKLSKLRNFVSRVKGFRSNVASELSSPSGPVQGEGDSCKLKDSRGGSKVVSKKSNKSDLQQRRRSPRKKISKAEGSKPCPKKRHSQSKNLEEPPHPVVLEEDNMPKEDGAMGSLPAVNVEEVASEYPPKESLNGDKSQSLTNPPEASLESTSLKQESSSCKNEALTIGVVQEKLLEEMEVPPLSPLSEDDLIDSLIIFPDSSESPGEECVDKSPEFSATQELSPKSNFEKEINAEHPLHIDKEVPITKGIKDKLEMNMEDSTAVAEKDSTKLSMGLIDGMGNEDNENENCIEISKVKPQLLQKIGVSTGSMDSTKVGFEANPIANSIINPSQTHIINSIKSKEDSGSEITPAQLRLKLESLSSDWRKNKDYFNKMLKKIQEENAEKEKSNNASSELPGDKRRNLKTQLNKLNGKYFGNTILNGMITVICNKDNGFKSKNVAKYLVRMLSKEDEDDVQPAVIPGAPRLSPLQMRVLSLVLALENRCPTFSDLTEIMLAGMSFILFRLGRCPDVEIVKTLARMYTALCMAKRDIQRVRCFCYDALFAIGSKAVELILVVLSMWHEVLPVQESNREPNYIESSIFMALSHVAELRQSPKEVQKRIGSLKMIVRNIYKSEHHKMTIDQFLDQLMRHLTDGESLKGLEPAVVLLAKRQGWEWTHKNLLCGRLVSVMEDWKKSEPSHLSAVSAINLIGLTSRSCPIETCGPVKNIIEVLSRALIKEPCSDARIKEALVVSLIRLSKYHFYHVVRALDVWRPMREPPVEVEDAIRGLVLRQGGQKFWKEKYRSWKKPQINRYKTGVYFERSEMVDGSATPSRENEEEKDEEYFEWVEEEKKARGETEGGKRWLPKRNRLKFKEWVKEKKNEEWVEDEVGKWDGMAFKQPSRKKRTRKRRSRTCTQT